MILQNEIGKGYIMELIILVGIIIFVIGSFSGDKDTSSVSRRQLGKNIAKVLMRLFR